MSVQMIFEQISSALTVRSICTPLGPDIPSGSTDEDLLDMHCDPGLDPFNPSRVLGSDGSVVGIVWFESYACLEHEGEARIVDDVMERLNPNEMLSSSTTILEAVELFGSRPNRYFYVVHVNEVIGVLFYRDLFKPLGRLAFLALALEIEDQALALCRSAAINKQAWQSLSDNRRAMAIELFRRRYGREPNQEQCSDGLRQIILLKTVPDLSRLIGCTNLVDKATMIWKLKLVEGASRADVLGFFNDLKDIRDQCAHPGADEELISKDHLAHFVASAKRIRAALVGS